MTFRFLFFRFFSSSLRAYSARQSRLVRSIIRPRLAFLTLLLLSGFLAGCAGGATAANSWPGLTLDPDGETLYVAHNAHIYAVNLLNGAEKWRYPAEPERNVFFFAPPALTTDGQLAAGGYNNVFYSINPQTKGQNWVFSQAADRYIGGPLADEGGAFAPSADNSLYALDQAGSLRWKFTADDELWSTPATDGTNLYVSSLDRHLYALEAATGNLVWKSEDLGGSLSGTPALSAEGILYVGTFGSEVLALNSSDGRVLWRTPVTGWVWSRPLLVEDKLYFGDLEGSLFALSATDGSILWQTQPDTTSSANDKSISGAPALVGDTLYFAAKNGNLYAVDASNGNLRWSKTFKGKFYADILVSGETILLAPTGVDEFLIAVDINGNQKWIFPVPEEK
jgi:outer membrane protein assembly factor BamB